MDMLLQAADQRAAVVIAGLIVSVLLIAAGGDALQRIGVALEGIHGKEYDNSRQERYGPSEILANPLISHKGFRLGTICLPHGFLTSLVRLQSLFSLRVLSHLMTSIRFNGQTRSTTRPTTCSWATQPTAVLRLSEEVARWSPITKILPSGTW